MAVFYVSPQGSDAANGLAATASGSNGPFATINAALQAMAATPGPDTLYIEGGTYTPTGPINLELTNRGQDQTDENVITNFVASQDKIVVSDLGFNLGVDGGKGTATQQLAASIFSPNTNGTFAPPATGGSSTPNAPHLIATLQGRPPLTASGLFYAT